MRVWAGEPTTTDWAPKFRRTKIVAHTRARGHEEFGIFSSSSSRRIHYDDVYLYPFTAITCSICDGLAQTKRDKLVLAKRSIISWAIQLSKFSATSTTSPLQNLVRTCPSANTERESCPLYYIGKLLMQCPATSMVQQGFPAPGSWFSALTVPVKSL